MRVFYTLGQVTVLPTTVLTVTVNAGVNRAHLKPLSYVLVAYS